MRPGHEVANEANQPDPHGVAQGLKLDQIQTPLPTLNLADPGLSFVHGLGQLHLRHPRLFPALTKKYQQPFVGSRVDGLVHLPQKV